jgi:hypothetical protein
VESWTGSLILSKRTGAEYVESTNTSHVLSTEHQACTVYRAGLELTHTPTQGAAFTFNLPSYLTFLTSLRLPLSPTPPKGIPFPTFDHARKDPAPSPNPILPRHRIVLVEGLYTLLDRPGWRDTAEMYDIRVFVDCTRAVCRERVIRRNFAAGIVESLDKCAERGESLRVVASRCESALDLENLGPRPHAHSHTGKGVRCVCV